ncbi:hypothetical protein AWN90_19050 [Nocardia terpenica]|uniref:Conjugal transfer protein TrbL n=2 Tax=Nocardia terpenica TaxID=455432 RepID=A0A164PEY2_9NOCA|nr:hypothetical protein AWN90_19050 [Nocardia terpenica]
MALQAGGDAIHDAAASGFHSIADSMAGGFGRLLEWSMSWWVRLPSPDLTQMSALQSVRDHTTGLQVLLMTAAIMFTAARLALARRGALAGEVQESFMAFARAVFASWMFAAVITAATKAGDAFSDWVISDATHGQATATLSLMMGHATFDPLGTAAMFILCLIGFIGALLQLALLVVRQALLIVVVGAIPIAAAAAGTGPGSQAYKKLIAWAIAFALFKPVGAIVYLIAFEAAGAPDASGQQRLLGLILLALVGLVLPALMRMIAPAISTMGSGGGGVAAAAMLGGAVGMAAASGGKAASGESGGGSQSGGADSSADSGGSSSSGGGRAMTPSIASGDGGSSAAGGSGGGGAGGAGQAAQGGATSGGAGTAAAGAAAAGPAAAVMAAQELGSAAQRVGAQVGGEADAGAGGNNGRNLEPHEVRR